MFVLLETIFKEKINSTIIYMSEKFTVENFSSGIWKVSDFISKTLVSSDGFIKMIISVYPNGYYQILKNYVVVSINLLSAWQHCYESVIKLSILTPRNIQKNEKSFYIYWPENEANTGLNKYVSHQTCRNVNENLLNDDKLTILTEVFCLSLFERQSEILTSSSLSNSVEMWDDWTVCNLLTFPDVPIIQIMHGLNQRNSELVRFYLQLAPKGIQNSQKRYISLHLCIFDIDTFTKSLTVYFKFTIRNYGADGEVFYDPQMTAVFKASAIPCWGRPNVVLYEKAIKKSCITIELYSFYSP